MSKIESLNIPYELTDWRLDKALCQLINDLSRHQIQKLIKNQQVKINNEIITNTSFVVKYNDQIQISFDHQPISGLEPYDFKLDIVYEDDDFMVINKPIGLSVHPGAGNNSNTLVNALLSYHTDLSNINDPLRPGIVHRLDKDTSGIMVVAKNNYAHNHIAEQIAKRSLVRKYKALIWGTPTPPAGSIVGNIARHKQERKRMTVTSSGGKNATTYYQTLEIFLQGAISLVECKLETGRTHQIRVHMSHIGHSILGDQTYGHNDRKILALPKKYIEMKEILMLFKRQALHSYYIELQHPVKGQFMHFEVALAHDMQNLIERLTVGNHILTNHAV